MALKLVSFTVCPFVQRAVLMLREKDASFDIEYINLMNKPDWFLEISPRGKVPVLVADGAPLFESQAICEYLEDTIPEPRLMPEDAVGRARDRAWFTMTSEELFGSMWKMESAKDQETLDEGKKKFEAGLGLLEKEMAGRDWLSGDGSRFGFADVAIAPMFWRMASLSRKGFELAADLPNVLAWRDRVLERPTIAKSVPDSWQNDIDGMMKQFGSVLSEGA